MKKTIWMAWIVLVTWSCQSDDKPGTLIEPDYKVIKIEYPNTYRDTSIVDNYYGTRVADPYRWLEDDNSNATQKWVRMQQQLTEDYLQHIPYRDAIRQRLAELWNYGRQNAPHKHGDYYYFFKNDGLQNQDVLYRARSPHDAGEVVLDPNRLSSGGTSSLGDPAFSKDGTLMAYPVSEAGSDWKTIYIRDLQSGRQLRDTIRWVKFSDISWHQDGFFYSRYPAPTEDGQLDGKNEFHQLYYHRVGTPQSEDELVYADRLFPERNVNAKVTDDGRFLVLSVTESTSGNALFFRELGNPDPSFAPIVGSFSNNFYLVGSSGGDLYILTDYRAPQRRLIRIDTRKVDPQYWQDVLPETEHLLQDVEMMDSNLIAHRLVDAHSQLSVYNTKGELLHEAELPGYGTVLALETDPDSSRVFLEYTTFLQPTSVYGFSLQQGYAMQAINAPASAFDANQYAVKQVRYKSYDGTEVPMFVIHKKGLTLDGSHPTLLYGYGGFNIPVTPKYNRTRNMLFPVILENGGVCAVANIRGGGEFGAAWHKAGTLNQKQNVFDDFQAAAEYLIANKYTSSKKLAIHGASNGGLLVGACLEQRPDLYAVALPAVGVLDMLRYHRFTIGWAWSTDYGRSDEKAAFDYLYPYSPLHNLTPDNYPATLITTADHDDRVVPAHSFKFGARLQEQQQGEAPVLLRIASSAGHGAGKPTAQRIAEGADMLSFLFYNMQEGVYYGQEIQ